MIVDAGVGTASDAAIAMELGCTAVLMNTGIAGAKQPVLMAEAMRLAVDGGRKAFLRRPDAEARLRERLVADRRPDRVVMREASDRVDHRARRSRRRRTCSRASRAILAGVSTARTRSRCRCARRISTAAPLLALARARDRDRAPSEPSLGQRSRRRRDRRRCRTACTCPSTACDRRGRARVDEAARSAARATPSRPRSRATRTSSSSVRSSTRPASARSDSSRSADRPPSRTARRGRRHRLARSAPRSPSPRAPMRSPRSARPGRRPIRSQPSARCSPASKPGSRRDNIGECVATSLRSPWSHSGSSRAATRSGGSIAVDFAKADAPRAADAHPHTGPYLHFTMDTIEAGDTTRDSVAGVKANCEPDCPIVVSGHLAGALELNSVQTDQRLEVASSAPVYDVREFSVTGWFRLSTFATEVCLWSKPYSTGAADTWQVCIGSAERHLVLHVRPRWRDCDQHRQWVGSHSTTSCHHVAMRRRRCYQVDLVLGRRGRGLRSPRNAMLLVRRRSILIGTRR